MTNYNAEDVEDPQYVYSLFCQFTRIWLDYDELCPSSVPQQHILYNSSTADFIRVERWKAEM